MLTQYGHCEHLQVVINDRDGGEAYKLTLNNGRAWVCVNAPTAVSLTRLSASATPSTVSPNVVPVLVALLVLLSGVHLLRRR